MAAVPAALKKAELARFALRAGQLERVKPAVAYWCNYWIISQILAQELQKVDEECSAYSMNLMDKLEKAKDELAGDDAVDDPVAAQAYIEQFGLETFQRAENAMYANKASRQTADTFAAAATFLDLRQIWGPLDAEAISKSKFAKYHALRIVKALRAGEDPNLSNPIPEPLPTEEGQSLSRANPNVHMSNGSQDFARIQTQTGQPYVEEVSDEDEHAQRDLARSSAIDQPLHPSTVSPHHYPENGENVWQAPEVPSPQDPGEEFYHAPAAGDVSPMTSPTVVRTRSEGYGYFPTIKGPQSNPDDPSSPPDASLLPPHPTDSILHSFPPPPTEPASTPYEKAPSNSHKTQRPSGPSYGPEVPTQPPQRKYLPPSGPPPADTSATESIGGSPEIEVPDDVIKRLEKELKNATEAITYKDPAGAARFYLKASEIVGALCK